MNCSYVFTGFKLCPRNNSKRESVNWDPNWLGYVTPIGYRTTDSKRTVYTDVQFSVIRDGNSYKAARCRKHSQFNNTTNPIVAHDTSTNGFTIAVNELVRNQEINKLLQVQPGMYNKEYKLTEAIYVELDEKQRR
jgi:hypothetical protein